MNGRVFAVTSLSLALTTALCIGAMQAVWNSRQVSEAGFLVKDSPIRLSGVGRGAVVSHDFAVTNTSSQTLDLTIAGLSCSCLDANVDPPRLGPGQSGSVSLIVDVADAPRFDVVAQVACRSVDDSKLRFENVPLRLSAIVDTAQGLDATTLGFGEVRRGVGRREKEFRLRFTDPRAANLDIHVPELGEGFSVQLSEPVREGEYLTYYGKVTVDPDRLAQDIGKIEDVVKFVVAKTTTSEPTVLTEYYLRVLGKIVDELRATPDVLFWSRSNTAPLIRVSLDAVDGQAIDIQDVSVDTAGLLEWTIRDNHTPAPTLEVACTANGPDGVVRSELQINVGYHGKTHTVSLPIVVL